MTQSEFYETIKTLMTKARQEGWSYRQIENDSQEAVVEWLDENEED